jgi:ankyrin repeat protein
VTSSTAYNHALKMFELCEEYGCEVKSSYYYLIQAADVDCLPLIKFLMDHSKVEINVKGSEYRTPLQLAAKYGNVDMSPL